jgi:hypothetical protein
MKNKDFSVEIKEWLDSDSDKTFTSLDKVFGDRAFAILFMFLMLPASLPIPTAGVTDVFSVVTVLFALQMMIGKNSLWLPKRWSKMKLSKTVTGKLLPGLMKLVSRLERVSRPRLLWVFKGKTSDFLLGLIVLSFAIASILAPPFSGLDTLPSMGIVILSAGILLKDGAITIAGVVVGLLGILLQVVFGKVIIELFKSIFG